MKLSDYIVEYLVANGSTHAFGMSGGAAVHLFDSISRNPAMGLTCVAHEQSASMAADAFSRLSGKPGVCVVTSGPGATNLLTGVCCSYYDSVATIMLTGQVATFRLKGDRAVRQVGFQETDILSIFSQVSKHVSQLNVPDSIQRMLDEAFGAALGGRPGPAVLDIPDDLQRADVDPWAPGLSMSAAPVVDLVLEKKLNGLFDLLEQAKQPVIVLGGGLTTPDVIQSARAFLSKLALPVLQTWAGLDVLPADWPLRYGTFGVYAPRLGNFIIQNADLIVCLGTRLSQNLTGGMLDQFAPNAHIVMVDVDGAEMDKFDGKGIKISTRVQTRLDHFLVAAQPFAEEYTRPDIQRWIERIEGWRCNLPDDCPTVPDDDAGYVDAVHFVRELSAHLSEDEIILADTGGTLTWTCNHIRLKSGQRLLSAWNFTPMGYALPASLGAHAAQPNRPLTCIIGDGGLQLCLGELATILRYKVPLKIILFNNHCHGIQKQTLETWLEGNYVGVDSASGLGFSDFPAVAGAMGFPVVTISRMDDMAAKLREVYSHVGPVFCNVEINPDQKLRPFLKFGHALDDQFPPLAPGVAVAMFHDR
ncbi:MAG TPA: thiamine pyrophosphate-binding protein [Steroidobacteraceae bacterium]|nr:thiamine pyrophosphate-binding protein [Steroidobacteraceae bacterium]